MGWQISFFRFGRKDNDHFDEDEASGAPSAVSFLSSKATRIAVNLVEDNVVISKLLFVRPSVI